MSIGVEALTRACGPFTVVDAMSFAVMPGEILGLIGPNGAAKTGTLRCLAGASRPETMEPFRAEVYVGNWTEAGLVASLLESEGIEALVAAAKAKAGSAIPRPAAVYVFNEAQVERAAEIVGRYRRGEPLVDPKSYRSWRCRGCNELVEGQFEICWNCGAPKG